MRHLLACSFVALLVAGLVGGEARGQSCNGGGFQYGAPQGFNYAPPPPPSYYYAPPAPQYFYGSQFDQASACPGGYCPPAYFQPRQSYYAPQAYGGYGGYPSGGYGGPRYRGIGVVGFRSR
jgi:hypothetical protein